MIILVHEGNGFPSVNAIEENILPILEIISVVMPDNTKQVLNLFYVGIIILLKFECNIGLFVECSR